MATTPDSPVLKQALAAIGNRIVAAFAVAFIAAAIWAHLADASFVERLGWCLAIAGAAMTMPRTGAFGRQVSNDSRQWLGWGPEPPEPDLDNGDPGLTRIGVLLFVSIPLFVTGLAVSNLA
jgi:hypothetical protein